MVWAESGIDRRVLSAFGAHRGALRLYDEAGLLAPDFVDDATGYRYYAPAQLDRPS